MSLTKATYSMIEGAPINVLDYGAVGNGVADDTAAIQAAINACPANGSVDFGSGTYIVGSQLSGTSLSNARLYGRAIIKAKNSTDFQYILDISNTTGVTVEGLTFDANKAGRGAAVGSLSCLKTNTSIRCTLLNCTFKNALGTASSSVAVSASGGCSGLLVIGCSFVDLGTSANVKPCDGIFVRGDYCIVYGCNAENVTDSAFVLEGCNYSMIANVTAKNCTSIAWISNDTSSDNYGNMILGVSGTCNHVGSFGGMVGLFTASTGKIVKPIIDNINVRVLDAAAGGGGPMIFLFGNIQDAKVSNIQTDPGATANKVNHAILIEGVDGVQIENCTFKGDTIGTCCRLLNTSARVNFDTCTFASGLVGIAADGTCSFTEFQSTFISCPTEISLAGSAVYNGSRWQSWVPVYSSNIGDAAATFTATPTTTKATISRIADTITVNIYFTSTLRAVTPNYIELTLPTWAAPKDNNLWTPANVLNDTTYETGILRTIGTGSLRFYRANLVNYSTNANVEGRVSFSYETAF